MTTQTTPETITLRTHLKDATRGAHQQAEEAVGLNRWLETRETYADYLEKLWQWHAAYEPAIVIQLPEAAKSFAIDRLPQLKADLAALGRNVPTPPKASVKLASPEAAVGAWYVVLGSSMGGAIITKTAQKKLGDVPTAFLADPTVMRQAWPGFVGYLSTFVDPSKFASGEEGANTIFKSMQDHFSK